MIGCLSLLFRLTGFAIILLALAGAWLYRDRIVDEAERLAGRSEPMSTGVPSADALAAARRQVAALRERGPDSIVLGPDESAALISAGLPGPVREHLDSLTVGFGSERIELSGLVRTGRLPADLVGPLSMVLREQERISAGGTLSSARGSARVMLDRFAIRSVPLPRDAVPRLVTRALGEESDGSIAVQLPPAVSAVRVRPQGVILYRDRRP